MHDDLQAKIDRMPFFVVMKRSEAKVLYTAAQDYLAYAVSRPPEHREALAKLLASLKEGLSVGEDQ